MSIRFELRLRLLIAVDCLQIAWGWDCVQEIECFVQVLHTGDWVFELFEVIFNEFNFTYTVRSVFLDK